MLEIKNQPLKNLEKSSISARISLVKMEQNNNLIQRCQLYSRSFWCSLGRYDPAAQEVVESFIQKNSYAYVTKQENLLTFHIEVPNTKYGTTKKVDISLVPESHVNEFLLNAKGEGSKFDNLEMTLSVSEQEELWLVFEAKTDLKNVGTL